MAAGTISSPGVPNKKSPYPKCNLATVREREWGKEKAKGEQMSFSNLVIKKR